MFLIGTLLSLLCILGAIVYTEIKISDLLNLPTFLILFFPVFFTGFLTNPKEFGNAFRNLLSDKSYSKKIRIIHSGIFEVMGKVSYGVGWIAFLIFINSHISNLIETPSIEIYAKIIIRSSLPLFYGLCLNYLLFLPASIKVKNNVED